MPVCTFFGHRHIYLTDAEQQKLTFILTELIQIHHVKTFWIGGMGHFDSACQKTLTQLKNDFPDIQICLALAYIPTNQEDYKYKERFYDKIFCPEGIENGPKRFAITRRNRWLVLNSDYVICYINHSYGGAYQAMKTARANGKKIFHLSPLR